MDLAVDMADAMVARDRIVGSSTSDRNGIESVIESLA
jgi:hypothetical protein